MVDVYRRMLALCNHYPDKSSKILDFGCGAGNLVYAFRDAGFDACGFDIHDYLDLRSPNDRKYFQIGESTGIDSSEFTLDWSQYRMPYEDGTFDVVVSSQTMEHVLNLDGALRELARVTKPKGIAIHILPSRYTFRETHTFVPFGSLLSKFYWYNYFWVLLGVRNEHQKGRTVQDVAERYTRYAHTGTCYLPIPKYRELGLKYFEDARFAPDLWFIASGLRGWHLLRPALLVHTLFAEIVWVLEMPRQG